MVEEVKKSSGKKPSGSKKRMKLWMKMKEMWKYKLRTLLGSGFRWKRLNIQISFFDDLVFKLASVVEAIVLVSTLGFFFLCCGCHF